MLKSMLILNFFNVGPTPHFDFNLFYVGPTAHFNELQQGMQELPDRGSFSVLHSYNSIYTQLLFHQCLLFGKDIQPAGRFRNNSSYFLIVLIIMR